MLRKDLVASSRYFMRKSTTLIRVRLVDYSADKGFRLVHIESGREHFTKRAELLSLHTDECFKRDGCECMKRLYA